LTQSGRRDGAAIASVIDDAIGILGAVASPHASSNGF
jgi:hypothetical protein